MPSSAARSSPPPSPRRSPPGSLSERRPLSPPPKPAGRLSVSLVWPAPAIAHAALKAVARAHADAVMQAIREAQAAGAKSLRQIAAVRNGRGVVTPRGGRWEAQTVANALKRSQPSAELVKVETTGATCEPIHATLKAQRRRSGRKTRLTMGNSMRRGPPRWIVVAAVGLAFGMVYRYLVDEPSEANVANYIRSGIHGISVALVAWGANRFFNLRA